MKQVWLDGYDEAMSHGCSEEEAIKYADQWCIDYQACQIDAAKEQRREMVGSSGQRRGMGE